MKHLLLTTISKQSSIKLLIRITLKVKLPCFINCRPRPVLLLLQIKDNICYEKILFLEQGLMKYVS